jgi:general secretion pathway protein G
VAPDRRSAGFTLVEIMIVVAIIGLLASIAIASMVKTREVTRHAIALNDIRQISDALGHLAFDTGKWPGAIPADQTGDRECWDLAARSAGLVDTDGAFPTWKGPYIDHVPLDPWGSAYFFDPDYNIGGKNFAVVGSFGPNRQRANGYDGDDIYMVIR